ncbi:MAG: hypothetical protein M1830_008371 [Pleopsidium flavum]|nr:MAG: hypothetical protein M1830_008371 [Pleopsidium flavum]
MAEEPQPATLPPSTEPTEPTSSPPTPPLPPKSAEDLKTAAALSSLDARGSDDDSSMPKSQVDQEALGKAMSRLEVGTKKTEGDSVEGKRSEEMMGKRRVVKVDVGDVGLLVEELELSKGKATDLLKAHEGDAVRAMRAFVSASA